MADISKRANHTKSVDEIKERVEKVAGDIARKMGVQYSWDGNQCNLKGGGLKNGKICVTSSDVSIELTLGMMAKMMKSVVETEIDSKIAQIVS